MFDTPPMLATSIDRCRICGNPHLLPIIDLGTQALTGRFPKPGSEPVPSGPVFLVLCAPQPGQDACGHLQLAHDYALTELYGDTYGYRSSVTSTMVRHLETKAANLIGLTRPGPGDAILDIGCNDGTMLGFYGGLGARRIGIDPSSGQFAEDYPDDIELVVDFFSADRVRAAVGEVKFKIVTSIAMFYDLADPLSFMRDVRAVLAPDGVWEMEQSYMPTMLSALAYDTLCHEHLSYYRLRQIAWMAERADLTILDVGLNDINGGSFRVLLAPKGTPYPRNAAAIAQFEAYERDAGFDSEMPFHDFARRIVRHRDIVRAFFDRVRAEGKSVMGYGASTKGNVVIQYCGLTKADVPAIMERYPRKFGLETPGSAIPIISEEEGRAQKPDYLFVFPWHFRDEMIVREAAYLESGGRLVFSLPRFEIVGPGGRVEESIEVAAIGARRSAARSRRAASPRPVPDLAPIRKAGSRSRFRDFV